MPRRSPASRPAGELGYATVVGQVLATLRERQGIKQGDIAERVGLSQSAFSRLEKGSSVMNLVQLHKVCAELGVLPSAVLAQAEAITKKLKGQGVRVLPEKPDNAAAALVGLGLSAALLLRAGK